MSIFGNSYIFLQSRKLKILQFQPKLSLYHSFLYKDTNTKSFYLETTVENLSLSKSSYQYHTPNTSKSLYRILQNSIFIINKTHTIALYIVVYRAPGKQRLLAHISHYLHILIMIHLKTLPLILNSRHRLLAHVSQ